MYIIKGTYQGSTEDIDTAETLEEAENLICEYRMAFGADWVIYYE